MRARVLYLISILIFLTSCQTSISYLESRYIKISEDVLPSVVEVIAIGIEDVSNTNNWQDFFQDLEDQQSEKMNTGVGSGVVLDRVGNDYYIITNKHVVGDLDRVSILLFNNEMVVGEVLGADERFDIAVVKVTTETELPVAKVNLKGNLRVGQFVAALGSPMSYVQSISMGIISNLGRFGGPKDNLSNYIQTDAAINHGNSGGPLVDIHGDVIGINTWISSPTSGSIGLGFAMPIENVYRSYLSIRDSGSVRVGWFGISSYGLPNSEVYKDQDGAFINQVIIDSPAYIAGFMPGDIITKLNDYPISIPAELFLQISKLQPNEDVSVEYIRKGVVGEYSITLSELMDSSLETSKKVFPGFILAERDDSISILQVLPKSIGLASGFLKDDVIVSINDTKIQTIDQFYDLIVKGVNNLIISREEEELVLELHY